MNVLLSRRRAASPALWALLVAGGLTVVGITTTHGPPAERQAALAPATPGEDARVRIAEAETAVRQDPDDVAAYHRLAIALMRAQRETGDSTLSHRAEQALLEAKRRSPEDYQTRKLLAWVLASRHRFDEALALARECARRNPSDAWNYGVIGDSLTETGDYAGALAAVQKMIDLRPGPISYSRAAHQRRLHGDPEGALELYALALEATNSKETESLAWTRTQMGEIRFLQGDLDGADQEYQRALEQVPAFHLALAGRARLLAARGRLEEAAAGFRSALERAPRPDWTAALGDVYLALGRPEDAEAQYAAAERYLQERLDDPTADATHALAEILADRGRDPERALRLARKEAAGATDIRALDTLAWALYHTGRHPEAWKASRQALRLGTRDPKLLYHAGMIALKLPDRRAEGRGLLRKALHLHPNWHVLEAPAARHALEVAEANPEPRPVRSASGMLR